ncbi:endonuclease/exonuclease/phosphatase family protein [Allokutzneria sp. A3M-2-11 16]|uniref:endonuclease/exonuclease/phosphatase family protein n=1 Tax=Allokutzneria sp. A3M-2-11 16 TaxID=2962043 RepID=UPI0020B68F65|nr:endonuclease/exonuclease/phosphatase family protein [Allokutzneria sp. A3M-2-11 16]MCP3802741.1 endonuclease/exonuclease/phosphatase family protein [Allokutzneria sp. A3M-2-11 16]
MRRWTLLLTVAALLSAPLPAVAAPPVRVLTHNVKFLPKIAAPTDAQDTRAGLIANASYIKGYDVVVLNEVFDNPASEKLLQGLRAEYPYQTPVVGRGDAGWDGTYGDPQFDLEDGGVAIVSKFPISARNQYIFTNGCGADGFSSKGFAHAKITVRGLTVNVVGTHVQADDSTCPAGRARALRAEQFREIDSYLDQRVTGTTVIAGDLNVHRDGPEYPGMLTDLDALAPTSYAGPPSWSPSRNSMASGSEEHLDYVLLRRGAGRAAWRNETLLVKSPEWQVKMLGVVVRRDDEYSDHFPVAGSAG